MSFLGIKIPHEAARLINNIDVPGAKTDSAQLHITLLYLGDEIPVKDLAKAMVATYRVTQETAPFLAKLNCVDYFPPLPDGAHPIIAPVSALKLHELHSALSKSFGKSRIEYSKKYKEYRPHITLSFYNEPINKTKIEPIEWAVQELVLWGGSNGDDRIFITFPLALKKNGEISDLCCKE